MTASAIPPKIRRPLSWMWMLMVILGVAVALGNAFLT
jgi:hypothetical protein